MGPSRRFRTRTYWPPPSGSSPALRRSSRAFWRRFASAALLLAALALGSAALPAAAQEAPPASRALEERLRATPLPPRDPYDLAARLRGAAGGPTRAYSGPLAPGHVEEFWIVDQHAARMFTMRAAVRLVTEHATWFVQVDGGYAGLVSQAELERSAATFEQRVYPAVRRSFGAEPSPGVDGDPRIVVLMGHVPGVAAYFSGADAYPRSVNPRSNERDIIYVNLDVLRPGNAGFDSTLAHEFQHMVHFNHCANQETWVDEGSAELATAAAGYGGRRSTQFSLRPDVQLTAWTNQPGEVSRHYQAAYLFLRYVMERGGGWEALADLYAACARGPDLFDRYARERGIAPDFDSLVADWTVANLVNDPGLLDGRYGYHQDDVRAAITGSVGRGQQAVGVVPPYAAHYVEIPPGAPAIAFEGAPLVGALPVPPASGGGMWWSNRADSLNSRLTRRLDLRGLDRATLRFRAWWDIEYGYDYVYLSASRDSGRTWQVLAGRYGEPDTNIGNDYGLGWTGRSGGGAEAVWVDEEVDLSVFAGSEVLLRFEYVTDQGFNTHGFALDDLVVPELGLWDDAETDADWHAEGWLRLDALLPVRWHLRLVRWTSDPSRPVVVGPVPVDVNGRAWLATDQTDSRAVLVAMPGVVRTIQPVGYTVTVAP